MDNNSRTLNTARSVFEGGEPTKDDSSQEAKERAKIQRRSVNLSSARGKFAQFFPHIYSKKIILINDVTKKPFSSSKLLQVQLLLNFLLKERKEQG